MSCLAIYLTACLTFISMSEYNRLIRDATLPPPRLARSTFNKPQNSWSPTKALNAPFFPSPFLFLPFENPRPLHPPILFPLQSNVELTEKAGQQLKEPISRHESVNYCLISFNKTKKPNLNPPCSRCFGLLERLKSLLPMKVPELFSSPSPPSPLKVPCKV